MPPIRSFPCPLQCSPRLPPPPRNWPFQVAAVLYVPLQRGKIFSAEEDAWHRASVDEAFDEALRFHNEMEAAAGACILDLEVVVEER
jgi:hypothetical protein